MIKTTLKSLLVASLLGSVATFTACTPEETTQDDTNSGSLRLTAGVANEASAGKTLQKPMGVPADITIVTVDVENNNTKLAAARNLTKTNGEWNVDLVDLPLNTELNFVLHGCNDAKVEIFRGTESVTLTQKVTTQAITMYVQDDGEVISIPKITAVSIISD